MDLYKVRNDPKDLRVLLKILILETIKEYLKDKFDFDSLYMFSHRLK